MYGYSSIIGKRPTQQDALTIGQVINSESLLFGVFDGHGGLAGERCARLASKQLREFIVNNSTKMETDEQVGKMLIKSFVEFDSYLKSLPSYDYEYRRKKIPWIRFLIGLPDVGMEKSGSCACVMLSTKSSFIFANLGDSRAILSDGKRITTDHTSKNIIERNRVYASGGYVDKGRVLGYLVPSRTFGNFNYKYAHPENGACAISNVPDIHIIPITENMPKFIIIMCDGIHNVMKDKEIGDFCEKRSHLSPNEIAQELTAEAFNRGSKDNLSCIIVRTDLSSTTNKENHSSSDYTQFPISSKCSTSSSCSVMKLDSDEE